MTDSTWKALNSSSYASFCTERLPREKGGDAQVRFLQCVGQRDEFLATMDDIPTVGDREVDVIKGRFSEGQFKKPTPSTEKKIYDHWNDFTPSIASRTSFWAYVTLEHVRSGAIQPTYLATNGVDGQSGEERIDRALNRTGDNRNKAIDDCVRTVFRQLGGLPQARGNKSVFVDCPFARAWWRERLFRRAESTTGISQPEVGHPLRETKTHWEAFVKTMVSRNPILGMNLIQDALTSSLAVRAKKIFESSKRIPTSPQIERICQQLCFVGASRELGILDLSELQSITDNLTASM